MTKISIFIHGALCVQEIYLMPPDIRLKKLKSLGTFDHPMVMFKFGNILGKPYLILFVEYTRFCSVICIKYGLPQENEVYHT